MNDVNDIKKNVLLQENNFSFPRGKRNLNLFLLFYNFTCEIQCGTKP